ncbi:MAG: pantetheine-phosphate adenylyltransferase [Bacteroidales bacterium]|jgi:pantetheine-phosphate adenylyltransferase|nr:pantetheine-phosphate adenylyltransferase [Bacteroidales bacterium]
MDRIALFPGSFDPITKGHESVVQRALPLFDKIVVAIGTNITKDCFFSLEQRLQWVEKTFESNKSKIEITSFDTLTIEYCRLIGAKYILRGLRNQIDFQYESNIARINQELHPEVETVFLLTKPEDAVISSSFVKEILNFGGDASRFVPTAIAADIIKK